MSPIIMVKIFMLTAKTFQLVMHLPDKCSPFCIATDVTVTVPSGCCAYQSEQCREIFSGAAACSPDDL